MERAGVGPDINVVVQIDRFWPAKGQRYRIDGNGAELVDQNIVSPADPMRPSRSMRQGRAAARSLNMGSGATLKEFFDWVLEHHQADRYALVLWGHAYGLGFGRDHGDPMMLTELRDAIEHFARQLPKDDMGKERTLDLLGANACAMSYIEAACELSGCVDFIAASQVGVPFTGWPYQAILGSLTGDMKTEAFGQVDRRSLRGTVRHVTRRTAPCHVAAPPRAREGGRGTVRRSGECGPRHGLQHRRQRQFRPGACAGGVPRDGGGRRPSLARFWTISAKS